ncbi:MAG: hypothetical protein HGA85_01135 [Nanoarchaeota archaeon]|nr:hypothetical protein [Nanoarchaeota archaeon]
MMHYSRLGMYVPRQKRGKQSMANKEQKVDWVNIFLFILLFVVIVLFVVT